MCGSSGATLVCTRAQFQLSGTDLQVYLFNGSTAASKLIMSSIQGLGVYNLSSYGGTWGLGSVFYVDNGNNSGVGTDVTADWTFVTGLPGVGATFNAGADASGNGGLTTCAGPTGGSGTNYKTCDGSPGPTFTGAQDWVLFTFTHSGGTALNTTALTQLDWAWKAQRVGTTNVSIECESRLDQTDTCTSQGGGIIEETPVPEPATMSLMAFGLVGIAAAAKRRRTR